ncbi:MAG: Conserved rane protein of unknown function, partial [Modestobacter sp.]|nr:Conserved rane protein of unknown function [Modestobacter sp.]
PPTVSTAYGPAGGYGPPPGYGGYGPPPGYGGYGPPPGYGGYGPPGWLAAGRRAPTNALAVLAVALCFVFPPAALVTGVMARRQIQRTGESGDGLALAGIIIGGIATALFAVGLVFWMVAVASLSSGSFAP